jgi:AraC-like DNA-binding protein
LDKDFYIQQVADNFGMSRTIFYRRLRAITGLAPVEYVRNFRIRHACQLLHDPKYSIADVAYLCGFGTPQSFNKTFKEVKNCSPGEFRSKIVQNDQNG